MRRTQPQSGYNLAAGLGQLGNAKGGVETRRMQAVGCVNGTFLPRLHHKIARRWSRQIHLSLSYSFPNTQAGGSDVYKGGWRHFKGAELTRPASSCSRTLTPATFIPSLVFSASIDPKHRNLQHGHCLWSLQRNPHRVRVHPV